MEPSRFQLSILGLLGVVACFAFNFWLFRLGALWGILGLNITKHVAVAFVCQIVGVNRRITNSPPPERP
jgi:hypothetical protein